MLLLASVFRNFLIMQNLGMLEMGHLYIITLKVMILLGVVACIPSLALGRPRQENQKFKDCQIS